MEKVTDQLLQAAEKTSAMFNAFLEHAPEIVNTVYQAKLFQIRLEGLCSFIGFLLLLGFGLFILFNAVKCVKVAAEKLYVSDDVFIYGLLALGAAGMSLVAIVNLLNSSLYLKVFSPETYFIVTLFDKFVG